MTNIKKWYHNNHIGDFTIWDGYQMPLKELQDKIDKIVIINEHEGEVQVKVHKLDEDDVITFDIYVQREYTEEEYAKRAETEARWKKEKDLAQLKELKEKYEG